MTTTIYITLIVMVIISGLFSVTSLENNEKPKEEETVIGKIGIPNTLEIKKQLYSKLIALVVFTLSLASLMAMYFIKG